MPAVSVIVLVYRVEEYIAQCARNLFGQTLRDVEFIFVDDCSPDGSMEVLENILDQEFPWRRSQVRILKNEKNSGQAYSRRRGVEASTGKYTIHCDSDDWQEPDMLEKMYLKADANDADAVVCAWFRDNEPVPTKYGRSEGNCRDLILGDMVAVGEIQSLWRYMVKREVYYRGIDFPVYNQGEDHALMVQLIWKSNSVYCVDEPLYHWRTNMASVTRDPSEQGVMRRFQGDCANDRLVEAFLTREGVRERFDQQLAAHKLLCMFDLRPLLRKGEALDVWRNEFPEIKGKVLFNKHIKFVHKLEYLTDRYCPPAIIKAVYKWRSSSR